MIVIKGTVYFIGILIIGLVIGAIYSSSFANTQEETSKDVIKIPYSSKSDMEEKSHINGSVLVTPDYPVNERGQTYGTVPDIAGLEGGSIQEPDLIRAVGVDGTVGYVKSDDLAGPLPKTPEEAVMLTKKAKPREIPLYDVDGVTVIGKFIVGG